MLKINRKGQHIIEYCAVIALVALAIILMRNYVYRSVWAHLKMWGDGVNDSIGPTPPPDADAGCATAVEWQMFYASGAYSGAQVDSCCCSPPRNLSDEQWGRVKNNTFANPMSGRTQLNEQTGFCLCCAPKIYRNNFYIKFKAPGCGFNNWQTTMTFSYGE